MSVLSSLSLISSHLLARQQPKQPAAAQEESKPGPYYCLAPDEMSLLCDFCCPCPPPITKGQVPHCLQLIISFHQHLHDHLQGHVQLREINQMEHAMCQYLDWELNIKLGTLLEFEDMVHKDFTGPRPYPTYVLQTISKLAMTSTNPFPAAPNYSTSPIPSFGHRHASLPKPTPLPPQIHHQNPQSAYISPPSTLDMPSPCRSDSTSPASSALPPMPTGMVDDSAAIMEPNSNSPGLSIRWSTRCANISTES